jgi:hypothetical protein
MQTSSGWKKYVPLIVVGGLIPTTLILGSYFDLPKELTIPLVVFLSVAFGAMALWSYANWESDGAGWW